MKHGIDRSMKKKVEAELKAKLKRRRDSQMKAFLRIINLVSVGERVGKNHPLNRFFDETKAAEVVA